METSEALCLGDRLRDTAYARYGWHEHVLRDAIQVGRLLQGDQDMFARFQARYEEGFDKFEFLDPCLWSLLETVLLWYRHAAANVLKAQVKPPPPVGEMIPLQKLADFLTVAGMYGEGLEYEYLSQISTEAYPGRFLPIQEFDMLPCWTIYRLAELYAIAEEN